MSTEATLMHHLQAIPQGVDEIMRDYVDESVLFTPDGPMIGPDGIRSFFDEFLSNSPPDLVEALEVVRKDVKGDTAYLIWKAEPYIPYATDTFVIRDGKILTQTFAALVPSATET